MIKLYLFILINTLNYANQPRIFSNKILHDYQQIKQANEISGIHKKVARVSLDLLVLIMPETSTFELNSFRKIEISPELFISDDYYQNWKNLLRGEAANSEIERELNELEKLEKIKLLDPINSKKRWKALLRQTEKIVDDMASKLGFDLVLKQNTVTQSLNYSKLSQFSILSKNIPDITLKIASQILDSRGWSQERIDRYLNVLKAKIIL